uniref:FMN-binding split barrel n=1 Tax=Kalanchoe fedtschenkoi TaxID=63787 RepID=A0A7N0V464_KALFE
MKGSKAVVTLAQKCKNILSSNWQGQLNTIKADAKGSKEEIHSSTVKYMFLKDKPFIWVPEDDFHNVNAMIDERGSFSVTTQFPGPLGSILKSMKKLPARVALTGDVIALKEKRARLADEMIRESMLVEHNTISNSSYAVSGVLSSSNLGFTSRSERLLELLDGEVQYTVYKLDLRSCAFIDINGGTHDVDLEYIAAAKADPLAPFTAALIDGINQSEMRRKALMLFCFTHFNANVRDAFLLSVDRTGFDIVGKVPRSAVNDGGSVTYEWKQFRVPLKQEARDIETFCQQLVVLEDETLKSLSSYSGLG